MARDILIVDDEIDIRRLVAGILADEGYETRLAGNSDDVLRALGARRPSLVVLDIWLQGSKLDGLKLLQLIKRDHVDVPVIRTRLPVTATLSMAARALLIRLHLPINSVS